MGRMHDLQIFDSSLAMRPTIIARFVVGSFYQRDQGECSGDKATSGPLFTARNHFGRVWVQREVPAGSRAADPIRSASSATRIG